MPVAIGIVAPFAGKLADRLGARPLTVGGMVIAAVSLAALGVDATSDVTVTAALAGIGLGLGLFTPPNNAAIMGCVPRQQAGVASGILNMTRGLGTALGLAVTSLVFGLAGGGSSLPADTRHAFTVSAYFLAGVAAVAGLLAALRGPGPLETDRTLGID